MKNSIAVPSKKSITKNNLISIIIICVSVLITIVCVILFVNKISVKTVGFDNGVITKSQNAYFGETVVSQSEYSYIFFTTLYSTSSGTENYSYEDKLNFLNENVFEGDISTQTYGDFIKSTTENQIRNILCVNKAIEFEKIEIDCSDSISNFKSYIESKMSEWGLDEKGTYNRLYGPSVNCFDDIESMFIMMEKMSLYPEYSKNKILSMSLDEIDKLYSANEKYILHADIDAYTYTDFNQGSGENTEDPDNTSVEIPVPDFITEAYSEVKDYDSFQAIHEKYDQFLYANYKDYPLYSLGLGDPFIDWATSPDRVKDSTALIKNENNYTIPFFHKCFKDESPTYNGMIIYLHPDNLDKAKQILTDWSANQDYEELMDLIMDKQYFPFVYVQNNAPSQDFIYFSDKIAGINESGDYMSCSFLTNADGDPIAYVNLGKGLPKYAIETAQYVSQGKQKQALEDYSILFEDVKYK